LQSKLSKVISQKISLSKSPPYKSFLNAKKGSKKPTPYKVISFPPSESPSSGYMPDIIGYL